MRRFLQIMFMLVLLVTVNSAVAIEKEKATPDRQVSERDNARLAPKTEKPDRASQKSGRDYDDFVDGNNNGIDDRMERRSDSPSSGDKSRNQKSTNDRNSELKRKSSENRQTDDSAVRKARRR